MNREERNSLMRDSKRMIITGFVIILSIFLSDLTALCKPPEEPQLQLIVIPAEATLIAGDQLQFKAEIKNDGNTEASGVEWQVMGGIGEVSANGLFTASHKAGRGMVRANVKVGNKRLTAYALVKIAEGGAPSEAKRRIVVIVRPESTVLSPGGAQKFTVEPAGDAQWRVIPPKAGLVTPEGVFTASQDPGKAIVIATVQTEDGKGTGRAEVLIGSSEALSPGPKLKLHISPKHARVDVSGSTDFEVKITGPEGQYPLEWEVNPTELGHIEGAGDRVLFAAGNELEGRALVTVRLKTESEIAMDWATVDVGRPGGFPSSKVKVLIVPKDASVKVGDSVLFAADITGDPTARPSWSVAPKKIGSIDENGLFTATAAGWGLIIAKVDIGKAMGVGQARIYVGTSTSAPLRIAISPQKAETHVGGDPVKFTVTDAQGMQVADTPIYWKLVPGNMGSIDQTGLFVPGSKPGQALITARAEGAKGSGMAQARVTITTHTSTGRLRVTIDGPDSLTIGGQYLYDASVTDSEGNFVESAGLELKWRVVPSKLGELVAAGLKGTFTPNAGGRGVIILEVKAPQGTGTGRISITVEKK